VEKKRGWKEEEVRSILRKEENRPKQVGEGGRRRGAKGVAGRQSKRSKRRIPKKTRVSMTKKRGLTEKKVENG